MAANNNTNLDFFALLHAVQLAQQQQASPSPSQQPATAIQIANQVHSAAPASQPPLLPFSPSTPQNAPALGRPTTPLGSPQLYKHLDVDSMTSEERRLLISQLAPGSGLGSGPNSTFSAFGSVSSPLSTSMPTTLTGTSLSFTSSIPMLPQIPASSSASSFPPSYFSFPATSIPNASAPQGLTTTTAPADWPIPQFHPGSIPLVYNNPYGMQPFSQAHIQALAQAQAGMLLQQQTKANIKDTPTLNRVRTAFTSGSGSGSGIGTPSRGIHTPPTSQLPRSAIPGSSTSSSSAQKRPGQSLSAASSKRYRARAKAASVAPAPFVPVLTPQQQEHISTIKHRMHEALHADQTAVLKPNQTPFTSREDAIKRLLPYHVYYVPKDEARALTDAEAGVPSAEDLVARATQLVHEFNQWALVEPPPPSRYTLLAEQLVEEDGTGFSSFVGTDEVDIVDSA